MSPLWLFPYKSVFLISEEFLHKRKETEFGPYMIKLTQMPQLPVLGFLLMSTAFVLKIFMHKV